MNKIFLLVCSSVLFLNGCAVGPDYVRPQTEIGTYFKEAPAGWRFASPADTVDRGQWWTIWQDDTLNQLTSQVAPANLSVAQARANYQQARIQVQSAQADFFPGVDLKTGATRNSGSTDTRKSLSLDASWELDFWGKTSRSVEAANATAEAKAAALGIARLSAEAQVVQNYFALRVLDQRKHLTEQTIALYQRTLSITENQYKAGIVSKADVASAQAQLKSAQAQKLDLELSRRQYEHAIAILIGKAPVHFSLPVNLAWKPVFPKTPAFLPGDLLERRPDIAEAERQMMAANARIGVAKAAFYPNVNLSASGGYGAAHLADLFNTPARVWSVGATLAETLFDGGRRNANFKATEAAYDASVAGYRLSILQALQEVEDNLAATSLLSEQKSLQNESLSASKESARIALNQYRAGTTTFVTVASAQASQFNSEQTLWQLMGRQLSAQALLVKSLGGGWQETE